MESPTSEPRRTLFTSKREKRLWFWTLVVVIAIFSTLGLARTLAKTLGDSGFGEVLFVLCCLLVLATILTQGLKAKPSGAEIGVAFGVAAAYALVFARMSVAAERTHLVEYGVVAVFIYEALLERRQQGRLVKMPGLTAIVATSLIGFADECIQAAIPSRVFDPLDILFNFVAAVMAVATVAALHWARGPRQKH